jgi:hypothetical protein
MPADAVPVDGAGSSLGQRRIVSRTCRRARRGPRIAPPAAGPAAFDDDMRKNEALHPVAV